MAVADQQASLATSTVPNNHDLLRIVCGYSNVGRSRLCHGRTAQSSVLRVAARSGALPTRTSGLATRYRRVIGRHDLFVHECRLHIMRVEVGRLVVWCGHFGVGEASWTWLSVNEC